MGTTASVGRRRLLARRALSAALSEWLLPVVSMAQGCSLRDAMGAGGGSWPWAHCGCPSVLCSPEVGDLDVNATAEQAEEEISLESKPLLSPDSPCNSKIWIKNKCKSASLQEELTAVIMVW